MVEFTQEGMQLVFLTTDRIEDNQCVSHQESRSLSKWRDDWDAIYTSTVGKVLNTINEIENLRAANTGNAK